VLGELAGEGRRAGRAGELGCGARTCWAEREAGKELAQVWAARGGKERKTGPAGERNRTGRRERGAWVGFGTKLGWVLFYFLSPFFSKLHPNLFEFKLNFEFKPYPLNKIKHMHQHECTNIFILEKF